MSFPVNRRQVGKGLLAGLAAGALPQAISQTTPRMMAPGLQTSPWISLFPGVWRASVGTPEAFSPVTARTFPPALEALNSMPRVPAAPLPEIVGGPTPRGSILRLPLAPGERLYGFGLQLMSFEQRGKKKILRVNADPRLDSGDSHAPVPFYVSTLGYGVLVDTARQVEFDCGNARPRPAHAAAPAQDSGPEATHNVGPEDRGVVTVEVPRAPGVRVYLFGGPTMLDAVRRYNLFSGGGIQPPAWGLGFWYRAYGHGTQATVTRQAHELRARKIPCDVFGLEPGWQSHSYSCTFTWSRDFPDPDALLQTMAALGLKLNLWEHAFTNVASPLFEPLLPCSGDYGVWGGLVPDFAATPARRIFGDFHGRTLIDKGVAGFKLDECDGSDFTGGWSFPDFSRFPSGIDGEQMHAVFGLRYQDAVLAQFRQRNIETYGLVRSSGALAAPYPFVLYSDLYDHRQFVRGLVNAGFAGLLWCPEVRDASTDEDLIRRLQTVVFSPLAMVNAWYIKNPPWKQRDREKNNADELQPGWEALEARCREIIGWRMQIVPYLRAAFTRYAADGTPPFRALALDYPGEAALKDVDDAYLVGDRMVVAPLFAGEAERTVILPAGQWHDFWTGKAVQGGVKFQVPRTTEKIPAYVKAGSIFPMATVADSTGAPESRVITAKIYGNGSLEWELPGELQLRWVGGKGMAQGTAYRISSWEQVGS